MRSNAFKRILAGRFARLTGRAPSRDVSFTDDFANYEAAARGCAGYGDPEVAQVVAEKTRSLIEQTGSRQLSAHHIQDLFVLGHLSRGRGLRVLELGGACGALFHLSRILIPWSVSEWTIVETPAMVMAARKLGSFGQLQLLDHLSLPAERKMKPDLVLASGALQYTPEPLRTLRALLSLAGTHLYLTRTAVTTDSDATIHTRQITHLADHGPNGYAVETADHLTSQPISFVPEATLHLELSSAGFEPRLVFGETTVRAARSGARSFHIRDLSFLLERRAAQPRKD